jgi:predicted Zn-dependent protease with MMP-like domain
MIKAVQDALDSLPADIGEKLTNVAVLVEERHPTEELFGIYDPTGGLQRIVIYRELHPSVEEVQKTVLHEIGHYFGADEPTVQGWGL